MGNKADVFCILEHKRMSDVCDQYLTRAKHTAEDQIRVPLSVISVVIGRDDWRVEQISFITGARSVNKQDLSKNLKFSLCVFYCHSNLVWTNLVGHAT